MDGSVDKLTSRWAVGRGPEFPTRHDTCPFFTISTVTDTLVERNSSFVHFIISFPMGSPPANKIARSSLFDALGRLFIYQSSLSVFVVMPILLEHCMRNATLLPFEFSLCSLSGCPNRDKAAPEGEFIINYLD